MSKPCLVARLLGMVVVAFAGWAEAGPTDLIGPNFAVSSGQTAAGMFTTAGEVAYSPVTRKFLVVWADTRNSSTTGSDIYGRLVNTDGSLSSEIAISTASGDQAYPTVTYNPQTDQFLVLWTDGRTCTPAGFCADIYGQLVDSNGTLVGTEFAVSTGPNDQRFQDAAYNSLTNQFLVVWDDNRNCSDEVWGRLLNADGTSSTGDFLVAGCSTGNLAKRTLAYDPGANRFLVLWGAPGGVGQFVNGDGTLAGSNLPLGLPTAPAVAFSSISGRFLAVAQDNDTPRDMHGQLITAGGIVGGVFDVSTASGQQVEGTVARYAATDQFLAVWRDSRNSPSPDCVSGGSVICGEIFGQYVNPDGTLAGTDFGILVGVAPDGSGGTLPRLAYGPGTGLFLVTWVDARSGCCSIFGQIIGPPPNTFNTLPGTNVVVQPRDTSTGTAPATLTFSAVTSSGDTTLTTSSTGPTPPSGFQLGTPGIYYSLTTTATLSGGITVCISYAGTSFMAQSSLRLFHYESGLWADVTTSLDSTNMIICGSVTSLSPFAIFQKLPSADLAIGKSGASTVSSGANLTYGIGVVNLGPNSATGVVVTDRIPIGTTFVSAQFAIGSCTVTSGKASCTLPKRGTPCAFSNGMVTCNIGALAPFSFSNPVGAGIQLVVHVTAVRGAAITNTATVSAANPDPKTANNSATVKTSVK